MEEFGGPLLLSRSDIEKVFTPKDALNVCEQTFRWIKEGQIDQIHSQKLLVPKTETVQGLFMTYPAYVKPIGVAGIRWHASFMSNSGKGLPYSQAVNVLNDAQTGIPLAIMEGMFICSMRTAGHAAVGAKYLAKKNSEVVAIVGCGFEARAHLLLVNELYKIKEVRVCDISPLAGEKFCADCAEMKGLGGLNIRQLETIEETVKDADVVFELTTARKPTISSEWIKSGAYVAPSNVEGIDPKLSRKADKWVVGNWERDLQWIEEDPGYSTDDVYATLDEIVTGVKRGRESDEELILMTHHGMSAFDTAAMHFVYNKAIESGLGIRFQLL